MAFQFTENQKRQYKEQGYIILENLFAESEMDELRSHIDVLNAEEEEKIKRVTHDEVNFLTANTISVPNQLIFVGHLHKKDTYIKRFIGQEKMVELATDLLGPDVKLYWNQSVYKNPEADRDFPWHQDNSYGAVQPDYITCWLALADATVENGCIWIHPGTHKQGDVEHKDTVIGKLCYFGDDPGLPVPLKKGSMVVFHSLLFHRSTPNRSDTVRKAYVIQYSADGAFNPETGEVYDNGPVVARGGKPVAAG